MASTESIPVNRPTRVHGGTPTSPIVLLLIRLQGGGWGKHRTASSPEADNLHPEMGLLFLKWKPSDTFRRALLRLASLRRGCSYSNNLEGREGRKDLLASDSRDVRNKRGLLTRFSLSLLLSLIT